MADVTLTARLGEFGILLDGESVRTGDAYEVRSPYDGELIARVHNAGAADIERAIASAHQAFETTKRLPSWKRAAILETIAAAIGARREELARIVALEAGKPIKTARAEVDRAVFTFTVASEEAKRIPGEIVSLDWMPGMERREALVRRVPLGVVFGITPFNFPLNLVAHKVAPAIAAGDPIIVKPSPKTPVSALMLGRIVLDAGWPKEAHAVFTCSIEDTARPIEDDRIKLLSFTGSAAVGWGLKGRAGRKRVTLELGGNAPVIVHRDADLSLAAERIVTGGFSYAGQSCISVQRIFVHEDVYDAFTADLVRRTKALTAGDPLSDESDLGPVIDAAAAARIEEWVQEAVAAGARILTGGTRNGTLWQPTIVEGAPPTVRVNCQEVFAPVVSLLKYREIEDAIRSANAGDFGLQAGIFTYDERVIDRAVDGIETGGIIVNDVPTFRADQMPYGGVKQSGFGREGLRYAIEDMTEMKVVVYRRQA